MVYNVVHRQEIFRLYRASTCSLANLVYIISYLFKMIIPVLIVFGSHGFWKKTGTYRETPKITFNGRFLLWAESDNSHLLSSSLPILNGADTDHLVLSQLTHSLITNKLEQEFHLNLNIPVVNTTLRSLTYIVFLRYELNYHSLVDAEVAITENILLPTEISSITIYGALKPNQRIPFRIREKYRIVDWTRTDIVSYKPGNIINNIVQTPLAVEIDRRNEWRLSSPSSQFTLSLRLLLPEWEFTYRTELSELLKWALVQYLPIFYIINFLVNRTLDHLYETHYIQAITCCK